MNITDLHTLEKGVSAASLFKGVVGQATAIQILEGQTLKEHSTQTAALLICISGEAVFEYESGEKHHLKAGDYVQIEPLVKHWVVALDDTQLVLFK